MPKKILLAEKITTKEPFSYRVLKNLGYQVCMVQSVAAFNEQLCQFQPDLIILNQELPECDSFGVCQALKSNSHTRLTPIIMLGKEQNPPINSLRAYEAGADYYCVEDENLSSSLSIMTRLVFDRSTHRYAPVLNQSSLFMLFQP